MVKPFTESIRTALVAFMDANPSLTNRVIGRKLGVSEAVVSLYKRGQYTGNVQKLEMKIQDFLHNEPARRQIKATLFENTVSRKIADACSLIRRTNLVGLIHGRAGIGKSCGAQLYYAANPTSVLITCFQWRKTLTEMEREFYAQVDVSGWDHARSKFEWLVHRFVDSDRPIIVDNAHYLNRRALTLFFNFNDATGCPVILIGNPEILDTIAEDEQLATRIGNVTEVTVSPKEARAIAAQQIRQQLPEAETEMDTIIPLAEVLSEHAGHFRAITKHANMAREIVEGAKLRGSSVKWSDAFRAANLDLVSEVRLVEK